MEFSFDFDLKLFQQIGHGAFSQVFLGEYDSKKVAIKVMDPIYYKLKLLSLYQFIFILYNTLNNLKRKLKFWSPFIIRVLLNTIMYYNTVLFNQYFEFFIQLNYIYIIIKKQHQIINLTKLISNKSPFIVFYTKSKETENSLYIVQEYLEGKTLTQFIKTIEMEETHIKQIVIELLNAVSYLHSQDIIHRDIKPDNIIITTEGQLKLIDFGLSSHSESKLSYDKCGTLLFMAPEMIFKQPYLKSVDIWSCGIIAYQLQFLYNKFYRKRYLIYMNLYVLIYIQGNYKFNYLYQIISQLKNTIVMVKNQSGFFKLYFHLK